MGGEAALVTSPEMKRRIQQAQLAQVQRSSIIPVPSGGGTQPSAGFDLSGLLASIPQAISAGLAALGGGATVPTALAVGGTALLGSGALGMGSGENLDVAVPGGSEVIGVGGVQFPWETPSGEGMIAPWTSQIVFPNGKIGVMGKIYPGEMGQIAGSNVAYYWIAGETIFWRLEDGRIACWNKQGVLKIWRPKRHIVIPRNMSKMRLGQVIKVEKMLDRYLGYAAKKSKRLKVQR